MSVFTTVTVDFKDKNKKANSWENIGEKYNLSAAEAEVKLCNIRTTYVWKAPSSCLLKNILRTQNRCF